MQEVRMKSKIIDLLMGVKFKCLVLMLTFRRDRL